MSGDFMKTEVRKLICAAALVGLAVLIAMPSMASTFLAMTEEQLVSSSDAIVQGEILRVESDWDPTGKVIVSHAVILVEDRIMGRGTDTIQVQTFGGTVGDYTVEASGFPRFVQGERVLLFVNRREATDRSTRVTGYQQGQFRVVERNGIEMAIPVLEEGVNIVQSDGKSTVQLPQAQPLAAFKDRLRATAQRLAIANGSRNNEE
jgi:hypothetical protein